MKLKKHISVAVLIALIANSMLVGCAADNTVTEITGTVNLSEMKVTGNGIEIADGNVKITKGGEYQIAGTMTDGMVYVNSAEKVKLRLSGASITNSDGPAIFFDNADKALITIEKGTENYIKDGAAYKEDAKAAIFSNDDLEIKGGGKLIIEASFKHGIAGDDDVVIENGNIVITSKEHGIKVNDTLEITGGEISVVSKEGKGIKSDKEVVIAGGKLNLISEANEGIESEGTIAVKGGEVNINASGNGINTAESKEPGTVYDIKITGGKTSIVAGKSGIDSYGNLVISGGEVHFMPPFSEEKAPVECKGTFEITGGKVFLNGKETKDAGELTVIVPDLQPSVETEKTDEIKVTLDGETLSFNTSPVIKNGTTLVGFRAILEALGASVSWDGEKRCAIAQKDGIKIELYIDSVSAYVNGEEKTLLTAPEIINDSTMIPVRFVSENLGMNVGWDEVARCVIIERRV